MEFAGTHVAELDRVRRAKVSSWVLAAVEHDEAVRGEHWSDVPMIERVSVDSLTPQTFFERFVRTRRPVVLVGRPSATWEPRDWLLPAVAARCGDVAVKVEIRGPGETFGRGQLVGMTISELSQRVAGEGDEGLYLTTQSLPKDGEGRPALWTAPLTHMEDRFPVRPALCGYLVPANVNVWIGRDRSAGGATSGLHHDFHDNLYTLVSGAKRFRLFDPSVAPHAYLSGALQHVHRNGRVVYRGEWARADGATDEAARAMEASIAQQAASSALEAAEEAMDVAKTPEERALAAQALRLAEEALDAAMSSVLAAECGDVGGNGEDDEEDEEDDVDLAAAEDNEEDGDDDADLAVGLRADKVDFEDEDEDEDAGEDDDEEDGEDDAEEEDGEDDGEEEDRRE
jgi:hypothetical protein